MGIQWLEALVRGEKMSPQISHGERQTHAMSASETHQIGPHERPLSLACFQRFQWCKPQVNIQYSIMSC